MLLVDCYNVLHAVMPPSLAGLDEAGLCALLGTHPWARRFGKIIVVADGRPKPGRASTSPVEGVSLRFSGKNESADDVIIALLQTDSAPRAVTVVSSDREIQRAARSRRAVVMESQSLVRELAKRSARRGTGEASRPDVNGPLPQSQVEQWLSAFKADPGALGSPQSPAEVLRRAKAEAARLAAEQAARPRKTTYRRYRNPPSEPAAEETAPEAHDFQIDETDSGRAAVARGRAGEGLRESGVSSDEAEQWLREFGVDSGMEVEVENESLPSPPPAPRPEPIKIRKKPAPQKPHPTADKIGESLDKLSDGDIEAWLRVFGLKPDETREK